MVLPTLILQDLLQMTLFEMAKLNIENNHHSK